MSSAMSKGKKKNYNKPILPVKVGGIKVPPPKPPKKVKKKPKQLTQADINKMLGSWVGARIKGGQSGYYQISHQPQQFNKLDPNMFMQQYPGYVEEYDADFKGKEAKKPTVGDWAEEWYEKQKKLG